MLCQIQHAIKNTPKMSPKQVCVWLFAFFVGNLVHTNRFYCSPQPAANVFSTDDLPALNDSFIQIDVSGIAAASNLVVSIAGSTDAVARSAGNTKHCIL